MSDPARELAAALSAAVLIERPDWGRVAGDGRDLLDLLHRLSTADLKSLAPGEGRPAVLTTPKGRIVEAISVHHLGASGVWILSGPSGAGRVLAHVKRYTFSERTGLADRTETTSEFVLAGPAFESAARAAGLPPLPPYGAAEASVAGAAVAAMRTSGFDAAGLTVVAPREAGDAVRAVLAAAAEAQSGTVLGEEAAEAWRILRGFPLAGRELTEEHNPLEAGLRDAVSFTKGCYVGQEVVARLNTYDKVARGLVRLEIEGPGGPPPRGARVLHEGREVGTVTSAAAIPGRRSAMALAYVRWRDVPEGASRLTVDWSGGSCEAAILGL